MCIRDRDNFESVIVGILAAANTPFDGATNSANFLPLDFAIFYSYINPSVSQLSFDALASSEVIKYFCPSKVSSVLYSTLYGRG